MIASLGVAAWLLGGRAVGAVLMAVGVVSTLAAISDATTWRIPNRLVMFGLVSVAAGAAAVVWVDHRSISEVAGAIAAGWLFSGAPLVAALWLARPASIGGGDLKLLSVQGGAIGLFAPYAAPFVLATGCVVTAVSVAVLRRTQMPLGPGLVVGYLAAVIAGMTGHEFLGGTHT